MRAGMSESQLKSTEIHWEAIKELNAVKANNKQLELLRVGFLFEELLFGNPKRFGWFIVIEEYLMLKSVFDLMFVCWSLSCSSAEL